MVLYQAIQSMGTYFLTLFAIAQNYWANEICFFAVVVDDVKLDEDFWVIDDDDEDKDWDVMDCEAANIFASDICFIDTCDPDT